MDQCGKSEWNLKQKSLDIDSDFAHFGDSYALCLIYRFEKMISGMYMGEIVRLVLEKLRKSKLIFNGKGSEEMSTRGRFFTKYVSEIERWVQHHLETFEDYNTIGLVVICIMTVIWHVCYILSNSKFMSIKTFYNMYTI